MKMFGTKEFSRYCEPISSVLDICSIYQQFSRESPSYFLLTPPKQKNGLTDEKDSMQYLVNLAMAIVDTGLAIDNKDIDNDSNYSSSQKVYTRTIIKTA